MPAPVYRSPDPQTYQHGVPYQPPLATVRLKTGSDIPDGASIGGGQGDIAAVINVRGMGPLIIRAPSGSQLAEINQDPQKLNRYLNSRFSEFRGFVDTIYQGMGPLDKASLWTSPIPIAGDVVGMLADAANYIQDPESRTLANGLLTLMSAAPLVPNKRLMDQSERVKNNVKAWHASPHRFDRFSMEKIGTGEGAQVYSRGLYFAENKATGEQYYKNFSALPDTRKALEGAGVDPAVTNFVAETLAENRFNVSAAQESLRKTARNFKSMSDQGGVADGELLEAAANALEGQSINPRAYLYNATLNVDPDSLLDWDAKPSKSQFEAISSYGDKTGYNRAGLMSVHSSGEQVYRDIADDLGEQEASEFLRAAGIPGVKYYDQGSRQPYKGDSSYLMAAKSFLDSGHDYDSALEGMKSAYSSGGDEAIKALNEVYGKKTRNYVIFDENLIDINSIE